MRKQSVNAEYIDNFYKERLRSLQEANRITDEMIKCLEEAGYDVENQKFENTLKYIEEWEKRKKQRLEEEKRKAEENN